MRALAGAIPPERRADLVKALDVAVKELTPIVGRAGACRALGAHRASVYRRARSPVAGPPCPRPSPPRALSSTEKETVTATLNNERFCDQAPTEVYATLLDEGHYLASIRTMYRLLAGHDEVRERRAQRRAYSYAAPELLATAPHQLWSWDITKLKGPRKWSYLHLYVILDVFSRYVVGWMVAERESAKLAERLISETVTKEGVARDQLTLHADRGCSMTSKPVALLLADLGILKSHSRPHVSNDNPYSEAQFKTLKYHPTFPNRFGGIEDARAFCQTFFPWYNHTHHHTGLGLLTPTMVHHGQATRVHTARQETLSSAYLAHPERFVKGTPHPLPLPSATWITPPKHEAVTMNVP